MSHDERSLDGIGTSKLGGRIRLRRSIPNSMTASDGLRLSSLLRVHRLVERYQLNTIPKGAPRHPRFPLLVDDEVGIDGIPVVPIATRSHDATLILPSIFVRETLVAEQSDGRSILAKGRARIAHVPLTPILHHIGCPDMSLKARHAIVRPSRNLPIGQYSLTAQSPVLSVGGSHLSDAVPRAIEVIDAILISHHWVVDERSIHHDRSLSCRRVYISLIHCQSTETPIYKRSSNYHCCS